jgi:ferredoxin
VSRRAPAHGLELVVDPIACAGHGICAELLPERIGLDDWGYPMIDPSIPAGLRENAARAVAACPALALALRRAPRPSGLR